MRPLKTFLSLAGMIVLAGCGTSPPPIVPGKGAIYGIVSADSHKAIVEKALTSGDPDYRDEAGNILYDKHMVNYSRLKELYVCLIDPQYPGGHEHVLVAGETGMSLRSLAIAPGDTLRIRNNTAHTQSFFISDIEGTKEGFQAFPPLSPGAEGAFTITLHGDLELGSEENERLVTSILSRKGLRGHRHSSGSAYAFERLTPGTYDVVFWFWRLGYIQRTVQVQAGTNLRLDEILSVDKIIPLSGD